jgi:hypothetical protein
MLCRSYLIGDQIGELILRQGYARKQGYGEHEANSENNLVTLHAKSSLDGGGGRERVSR